MRILVTMLLIILIFNTNSFSQVMKSRNNPCSENLKDAAEYFDRKDFHTAIKVLPDYCLNSAYLSKSNIERGYKILFDSYRAIGYNREADELYHKFTQYVRNNYGNNANVSEILTKAGKVCDTQQNCYNVIELGGRVWLQENIVVNIYGSRCYQIEGRNCKFFGRLYQYNSALNACKSLGEGWRLPSVDDWQSFIDFNNPSQAFFSMTGPPFNATLGGVWEGNNTFFLNQDGYYWTSTGNNSAATSLLLHKGKLIKKNVSKTKGQNCRCVRDL